MEAVKAGAAPALKLEIGREYRTRGGWKATVIRTDSGTFIPTVYLAKHEGHRGIWGDDGLYAHIEDGTIAPPADDNLTIVALWEEPDADGWIEWKGGECPVPKGTLVVVRVRRGKEFGPIPALTPGHPEAAQAWWDLDYIENDIIAYRVVEPAKSVEPALAVDLSTAKAGDRAVLKCGVTVEISRIEPSHYRDDAVYVRFNSDEAGTNYTFDGKPFTPKGAVEAFHTIIRVEPAAPKPFDWSTVKPGDAFNEGEKVFWYAAPFFMQERTHVIVFEGVAVNGYPHSPRGHMKQWLTRAPEHDIQIGGAA